MIKTIFSNLKEFKKYAIITPVVMIVEVLMEILIPFLMASIIDDGVMKGDVQRILLVGALMIVCAGVGLAAGLFGAKYAAKASCGLSKNLREAMYENIQSFSFANIDKFSTAGLVTRLTTDVTNIQMAFQMTIRMCVRAPISLVLAMIMSYVIYPKLANVYLIAIGFLMLIVLFCVIYTRKLFMHVFEKYDALNAATQENITGMRVVKAYVREDHEINKFTKASGNLYKMFVKAECFVSFVLPVLTATVFACILVISWNGAHYIVYESLTTGNLMSMLAYCMTILMNLMMLAMCFVMLSMSIASGNRIAEVLNEKSTLTNPENPIFEIKDGSISFENACFDYHGNLENPILNKINLEIKSGETIGIIGGTGSSKTSLINLISRLYDVIDGSVKVGGVDVREYDLETLRNEVSVVLQKNVLFSGTVLENLRWGDANATEEDCKKACESACAAEFIEAMPDGYNTRVEQGGTNFSGGQKQRLCIARALLKKPKVLILDDSTSAVDTATDAKIRKAFREDIADTTKIIIAQRISSVQEADKILVLENGKISGFDTHENLLASNEIYADIYESQTSGSGDFDEKGGEL